MCWGRKEGCIMCPPIRLANTAPAGIAVAAVAGVAAVAVAALVLLLPAAFVALAGEELRLADNNVAAGVANVPS
jgi:hypothetical protein